MKSIGLWLSSFGTTSTLSPYCNCGGYRVKVSSTWTLFPGCCCLTAQPFSLPACPRNMVGDQIKQQKSGLSVWPRVSCCHLHWWPPLCVNMVFVMSKPWLAVEQWSHKSEHYQIPLLETPRKPDTLDCCSDSNNSKIPIPNPKEQVSNRLIQWRKLSNLCRLSWRAISKPTPTCHLSPWSSSSEGVGFQNPCCM